jgi:hypothetical protein
MFDFDLSDHWLLHLVCLQNQREEVSRAVWEAAIAAGLQLEAAELDGVISACMSSKKSGVSMSITL